MIKTVGELIHSIKFEEMLSAMTTAYGDHADRNSDGYRQVWDTLHNLQPKNTTKSVQIEVDKDYEGNPWFIVGGIDKEGQRWAIEFEDWSEWLSMPVISPPEMSETEQLAHILWEMTFFGYNQGAIDDIKQEIFDRKEEAEEQYKSEKCKFN